MSSDDRLIAARYVEALFDLAAESQQHEQVKADMQALKTVLEGSGEFQKLLINPIISRGDSEKAIAAVLAEIKACDLTRKFFALLARSRRLVVTGLIIDAYLGRLAASRGELSVEVTSAQGLSDDEVKMLTGAIAKSTGKKVSIRTQENPALVGGLQVRVGSRLLDTSIAGKLARLRQALGAA
jgi:F-type H+-transporting ATPase subunit delta